MPDGLSKMEVLKWKREQKAGGGQDVAIAVPAAASVAVPAPARPPGFCGQAYGHVDNPIASSGAKEKCSGSYEGN